MATLWNHCRYYAGKLSLLVMMLMDLVQDLRVAADIKQREMAQENNGFGPISKRRDPKKTYILIAEFCVITFSVIILLIYRLLTSSVMCSISDFHMLGNIIFAIMLSEFIRRCCLMAEEIDHVEERYGGSKMKAFQACVFQDGMVEMSVVFLVSAAIAFNGFDKEEAFFPVVIYVIASSCISILLNLLEVNPVSDTEISEMHESGLKNVAAGLAWSYYFGFLKIILPEFQNVFQRARGPDFQVDNIDACDKIHEKNKKLFIIIPKDGYCYKEFNDFDERISMMIKMPAQMKNRGGVHQRSYQNTLYKIEKEGYEPKYAVMEFPTPILSMYDMSQYEKAKFTEENRRVQVVEFYKTLKNIIDQDPQCSGALKIILASDGVTGCKWNGKKLADIIWDSLV